MTNYLGLQTPVAVRGQATLPTGGAPVAPSAAPVAPGGTGVGAAPTGATPGGPSAKGGGGSNALNLAQLAANIANRLSKAIPSAGPSGPAVSPDISAAAKQEAAAASGGGASPTSADELMKTGEPFQIPRGVLEGTSGGGAIAGAPASQVSGGELAPDATLTEAETSALGAYAPYAQAALAAAEFAPGIIGRAGGKMPAGEQAALGANELIGLLAAGETAGLSLAVTPAFDEIISDWFGKPHKSRAESAALGNRDLLQSYNVLQGALSGAQTPEEIADAFATIEGQTYRGNKLPYPVAQGFDVQDRAALLKALGGDDPNALSFAWQGFGTEEAATSANTALNNTVRQQMGLIRAAQAGDPQARELLTALGEARKATLAQGEAGMEARQAAAEADVGGSYARMQQMM